MTAEERRRRRWFYTWVFVGGLLIGGLLCGVYRTAVAQPKSDTVPVVLLPSATAAPEPPIPRPRTVVVPIRGELPLSPVPIAIPMPPEQNRVIEAVAQVPNVLPLPKEEKPLPAPVIERVPIENPQPIAKPTPTVAPSLPPLGLPSPKIETPSTPSAPPVPLPPVVVTVPPPAQSEKSLNPMPPPVFPQLDFRLQSDESGNNVNSTGPLPPVAIPPRTALQAPAEVERIAPTPPPPTRGTVHAIATSANAQHRETPMPMSLRRQLLSALLGTAIITGNMYADNDPPAKPGETVATKKDVEETNKLLAELKTQLANLKKDLGDLSTKDIADIKKDVADLKNKDIGDVKKELENLKAFKKQTETALEGSADKATGGDGLIKKMTSVDEKLTALAKQLDSLDKRLSESSRTALSSPINKDKEPEKEKPKTGTVKIVNLYETDVDVLVNGKGYRLAPQESKTLTLAVGNFTYQLLTAGGSEKSRTIKDGEEVVLKIN